MNASEPLPMTRPTGAAADAIIEQINAAAYRIPLTTPRGWHVELVSGHLGGGAPTRRRPPDWDIRMRRLARRRSLMTRWATSWLGPQPWTSVQAGTPWPKRYATKGSAVRLPQHLSCRRGDVGFESPPAGRSTGASTAGYRPACPYTAVVVSQSEPRAAGRPTDRLVQQGLGAVKIKVGTDPTADPKRVAFARRIIGEDTGLFVDANGAYSRKQALAMAEEFSQYGVSWFEEPVSSDDVAGLHLLRNRGLPVWTSPPANTAGTSRIFVAYWPQKPWIVYKPM